MSVQTEINRIITAVGNAYDSIEAKGGTVPTDETVANLAAAIDSIPSGSGISAPTIGKDFNWTGGDGTYQVLDDGDGNWRIKFLSSGTFTPLRDMVIDAFLVGGGGSGSSSTLKTTGSGGGGGYTKTVKSIILTANTAYSIVVGAGGAEVSSGAGNAGGDTSAFSETVAGGKGGTNDGGGNGGSGGGACDSYTKTGCDGGSDGSDGSGTTNNPGGTGQGTTTREFGESDGDLYAAGGGGYYSESSGAGGAGGGGNAKESGVANTGSGGGAVGGAGGSGIVIIRKPKESAAPNLQSKSVTYTSNGTATVTPDAGYDGLSSVDVTVDVAGSGGGGIGEIFSGEVIPMKETPPRELFVTLPNGEQMTITDLWSSNPDNIWNKIVLNGDNVSFLIINTTDSYVPGSTQIKHISIDFYVFAGRKSNRCWRRCLNGASYESIADTLCFKTGSKYVYYWI